MPQQSFPRAADVQQDWLESVSYDGGTLTLKVWSAASDSVRKVTVPHTLGSPMAADMIAMTLHKQGLSVASICIGSLRDFLQGLR